MKFGLLYEIEVARPWTETSVADCFWEALEQVKVAEELVTVDADGHVLEPRDVCTSRGGTS